MLRLLTTVFKRLYFGVLEPFSSVSENPRRSIYARIFFASKRTLLPSNSNLLYRNAYNGCFIQKLRVKCSVMCFSIRSLAFSLVSYYTPHSPSFNKSSCFGVLEPFSSVSENPRRSIYARIFFASKRTLLPSNSNLLHRNSYNGCFIQKLRVKCSVMCFYIRSLAFSLVSCYTPHSPNFYKSSFWGHQSGFAGADVKAIA